MSRNNTRGIRVIKNTMAALIREVVTVICSLILPRLILLQYGSVYNGLISSIEQFLSYGALLQAGIAGTTRAALYSPIENNDKKKISQIFVATKKFINKVLMIFASFVLIFALIYPIAITSEFSWGFVASLIIILSINAFANHFFGIPYKALLAANQEQYAITMSYVVCVVLSTIVSSILISLKYPIHIVKLGNAFPFLLQPIMLKILVNRHFEIDEKVEPDNATIGQRWDSFAHQIANFIHDNTDIVILTLFTDFKEVSVYSIYRMVMNGVKSVVNSLASGIEAAFGSMIARKEQKELNNCIDIFEFVIYYVSGFVFSCTMVLTIPFVKIYTRNIVDINYTRPLFAVLFSIAELLWCIRIPYQVVTQAAGHYKQTKRGAILEPIINITVSMLLVWRYGIVGVAIGTIVAMLFRTIQYASYSSKNILLRPLYKFCIRMFVLGVQIVPVFLFTYPIEKMCNTYLEWLLLAFKKSTIALLWTVICIVIFDKKIFLSSLLAIRNIRKSKNI